MMNFPYLPRTFRLSFLLIVLSLMLIELSFIELGGIREAQAANTGYENVPISQSRPALDSSTLDSSFNETLIRRTDPSQNAGSVGLRHEYSRFPPTNADNSLLVLQVHAGDEAGSWQIRNRVTHEL